MLARDYCEDCIDGTKVIVDIDPGKYYLKKRSVQINVVTDKGNSWNEMWPWTNDEIGVAVQSWL